MEQEETYICTDIEADGPIPGPNSMISLASAAFNSEGRLLDTFAANLLPLPGAAPNPQTMEWWEGNPEAWVATQVDQRDPQEVMQAFSAWVGGQPGIPVFVAYPAGFDFTFVYWYLHRFIGGSPFSHSALDMKTLAMVLLGKGYRQATKNHWPREWKSAGARHTHRALDDAIEQGREFCGMLAEARRLPPREQREPVAKGQPRARVRRR
jgi:DNA polymerase III alpha subunit (gram-positive type)